MVLKANQSRKLYYTIKEVAKQFDLNESTLRYWESEFPSLRPKLQPGTKIRQYADKDIEQIKLIYNLVKVRGFKLSAARKMLQTNKEGVDKSAEVLETLISVRDELTKLKNQLEGLV